VPDSARFALHRLEFIGALVCGELEIAASREAMGYPSLRAEIEAGSSIRVSTPARLDRRRRNATHLAGRGSGTALRFLEDPVAMSELPFDPKSNPSRVLTA
jgi:hypothetical protein